MRTASTCALLAPRAFVKGDWKSSYRFHMRSKGSPEVISDFCYTSGKFLFCSTSGKFLRVNLTRSRLITPSQQEPWFSQPKRRLHLLLQESKLFHSQQSPTQNEPDKDRHQLVPTHHYRFVKFFSELSPASVFPLATFLHRLGALTGWVTGQSGSVGADILDAYGNIDRIWLDTSVWR